MNVLRILHHHLIIRHTQIIGIGPCIGGLFLHKSLHLHIGLQSRLFLLQEQPFLMFKALTLAGTEHFTNSIILAGAGKIREVTGLSLSSSLYHPLSLGSGMVGAGVVEDYLITAASHALRKC